MKKIILGVSAALGLTAANAAEIPSGPVTLEQCIQIALENNLDVRMSYYGPQLEELTLKGLYARQYDPALSLRSSFSNSKNKGSDDILQYNPPPSEIDNQGNNLGIGGGLTPFGTTYNIGFNSTRSDGFSYIGSNIEGFPPILRPRETYRTVFTSSITQPLLKNGWGIAYRTSIK
ncbi:MAG: TolC family protein, partial [Verrucomicrobiota bacterium]|nr:TolC family protein [Verrucomicrobiota bacterium]